MDTPKSKAMGTVDAQENGTTVDVSQMYKYNKSVTIVASTSPAWNGTIKIESSNDGTVWMQEGADVTGSVVREITTRLKYIRFRCSAYTAGSAVGSVFGVETIEN